MPKATVPEKAAQAIAEGRVVRDRSPVYIVHAPADVANEDQRKWNTHRVPIIDGNPVCNCHASGHGVDCHHAYAVRQVEAETTARARAWEDASAALHSLFAIIKDEDAQTDGEGYEIETHHALAQALDAHDEALSIDRGRGLVPPEQGTEIDWEAVRDCGTVIVPSGEWPDHDCDGIPSDVPRLDTVKHGTTVEDKSGVRFFLMGWGATQGTVVLRDPMGRMFFADGGMRLKVVPSA